MSYRGKVTSPQKRHNTLFLLCFLATDRLASTLHRMGWVKIGMVVILATSGCLMPPPVEEIADAVNRPPRIHLESLSPDPTDPQGWPKTASTLCLSYGFSASLSDPDLSDTLYWRVFLDYQRDPRPFETEVRELPPNESAKVEEAHLIEFSIDPLDTRLSGVGTHAVELFVADRPFIANVERTPKGRIVDSPGETDSFIWTLQVTDTPDVFCSVPR